MSASEDVATQNAGSPTSQLDKPERKSSWKNVFLVLAALMAVTRIFNLPAPHASLPATQAPPGAEAAPTGDPVTLASAIRDYKIAQTSCDAATFGSERNTISIQSALDACGGSMQSVMDLPALYGPPAAALQSCISMEGARLSVLGMADAIQDYRGDPMQNQRDKARYLQNFRSARAQCASDLVKIQRTLSDTQ